MACPIAALHSAGFEVGYVAGYFFPAEKNGCCNDMHCRVVTRHEGAVLEWDIAHHLKMATPNVCCGLNPKQGVRGLKLITEPVWATAHGRTADARLDIRLSKG